MCGCRLWCGYGCDKFNRSMKRFKLYPKFSNFQNGRLSPLCICNRGLKNAVAETTNTSGISCRIGITTLHHVVAHHRPDCMQQIGFVFNDVVNPPNSASASVKEAYFWVQS